MREVNFKISNKADKYLADVQYGLTDKKGNPATTDACINESLETLAAFEKATDDQLRNWLEDNYGFYSAKESEITIGMGRLIGLKDGKGKPVREFDTYYEEIPEDDGDTRIFFVVRWIKEWAMFALLSMGEIPDYEDNGISALDDPMRNSYVLDEKEFSMLHYKGNMKINPELMNLENKQSFE